MEDTLKQSVRTLTITKQIWDGLEVDYLHTDVTSQIANLKTLLNMNMNENVDVDMLVQNLRIRLMMCSFQDFAKFCSIRPLVSHPTPIMATIYKPKIFIRQH